MNRFLIGGVTLLVLLSFGELPARGVSAVELKSGVTKTIEIRFIQPEGEEVTVEEQSQRTSDIEAAARWWESLSPITTTLEVTSTGVMTVTFDPFENWDLLYGYDAPFDNRILVFVVDNSNSHRRFRWFESGAYGIGSNDGPVWVLTDLGGQQWVDTHELGHAVYGLEDLHSLQVDIMSDMAWLAYQERVIGCDSLSSLGRPCKQIFLPTVQNR